MNRRAFIPSPEPSDLSRRTWLKKAGVFIPATFAILRGKVAEAITPAQKAAILSVKPPKSVASGGEGPATYYYGSAGQNPTNPAGQNGDWVFAAPVVCTLAGSITKLGAKLYNLTGADTTCKFNLYYLSGSDWLLHESKEISVATAFNDWIDATLVSPRSCSAGETVRVAYRTPTNEASLVYYGGTTGGYYQAVTYANASTLSPLIGSADYAYSARVYVA